MGVYFLLVLVLIALANQKISSKAEFGKEHFEAPVGDVVITRNGMNETISVCTYCDNIGYPQYCCDGTWCCCYSTQGSCSRNANCYSNYFFWPSGRMRVFTLAVWTSYIDFTASLIFC